MVDRLVVGWWGWGISSAETRGNKTREEPTSSKDTKRQGQDKARKARQLGKGLEGTPEGEGVCVQGRGKEGTGWTGMNRLVFPLLGWTCPCWRRNTIVRVCM